MEIKVNEKCVPAEKLLSVEQYAQKTGYTRANIYYHIRVNNIKTVKIGNNTFIIDENLPNENQTVSENS